MLQPNRALTILPLLQIQSPTGLVQVPPMPLQVLGTLPPLLLQIIGVSPATLQLQLITANRKVVPAGTENQKKRITP